MSSVVKNLFSFSVPFVDKMVWILFLIILRGSHSSVAPRLRYTTIRRFLVFRERFLVSRLPHNGQVIVTEKKIHHRGHSAAEPQPVVVVLSLSLSISLPAIEKAR